MGKQTNLEKSSITCKHCGKAFHSYIGLSKHLKRQNISSEVYYDTYIKTPSEGMCKMCGKPTRFNGISHGYSTYCSAKCSNADPVVKKKMANSARNTYLEKYGVENISQLEEIKEKKEQTFKERYGVRNVLQFPNVIKKSHSKEVVEAQKETRRKTLLEKYGVENTFQIRDSVLKIYGKNKSEPEKQFEEYLSKHNIEYIPQYKSESYPYFCDFYLPKFDTYIELNLHWVHGNHPFNCDDVKDVTKADKWLNSSSEFSNRAYYIWTVRDVEKYNSAIKNGLRYVCVYDLEDFLSQSFNTAIFLNITVEEFNKILER